MSLTVFNVSRSAHKPPKVWNGIDHPIKKENLELLEERKGDPRKKRFQVIASTLERKPVEVRKCDPCRDRRMQKLPLNVTAGIIGVKGYP